MRLRVSVSTLAPADPPSATAFFPLVEKLPKSRKEGAEQKKKESHDPLSSTDFGARKFEEEEEHEKKKRGRLEALQDLVRPRPTLVDTIELT